MKLKEIPIKQFKARKGWVILEELDNPERGERKTKDGIIIPSTVDDKKQFYGMLGMVISTGDDVTDLERGMTVLFNNYDTVPFMSNGTKYHSIKEALVLAIVQ